MEEETIAEAWAQSIVDNFAISEGLDESMRQLEQDDELLDEYEEYNDLLESPINKRLERVARRHRFGQATVRLITLLGDTLPQMAHGYVSL